MARAVAALVLALALLAAAAPPARAARVAPDGLVIADADADAAKKPAADNTDADTNKPLPIVLWHGMGDSCCSLASIGGVAKFLESRLGVFVHSVSTGEGELRDVASSFYGNVNDQVAAACAALRSPLLQRELSGGFNMVGFSQGGQFLRAVVQRCGHELPGPVHSLVTLGAQHMGVSNAPACSGVAGGGAAASGPAAAACAAVEAALSAGAYSSWVRDHVVQAQYFKTPDDYARYLERNVFLPDVNNEVAGARSPLYKRNLASLERLVLYRFSEDTVVEPAESSHFGFWESRMYKEDWLGLRELDERGGAAAGAGAGGGGRVCGGGGGGNVSSSSSGALVLASAPGDHMQFRMRWFEEDVVDRWLAPPPDKGWTERARRRAQTAAAAP